MPECDLAAGGSEPGPDTARVTASAGVVAAASRRIGAALAGLMDAQDIGELPEGLAEILARLDVAGAGEGRP